MSRNSPARVLVGWLNPDEAAFWLAGGRIGIPLAPEAAEQVARAHAAVASLPVRGDQANVIGALPGTLKSYLDQLSSVPDFSLMRHQGFRVAMADLGRLYAIQPQVLIGNARERVAAAQREDVGTLARITLPFEAPTPPLMRFDEEQQSWIFTSPNSNLRVLGRFHAELEPEGHGFGFAIAVVRSFMQVSSFGGRYFLRDGYHRAYGLLERGIRNVPVMLKECANEEDLVPPEGMLTRNILFSPCPPLLPDFLDDGVTASIELAATAKTVVIHASELHGLAFGGE